MIRGLTNLKKLSNVCILVLSFCIAASLLNAAEPLFVAQLPDYDDAVYVPVQINGASHLFVVDSGATNSLVHSTMRESLGKPVDRQIGTAMDGSTFDLEIFVFPTATIGKLDLTSEACIGCSDLTPIREASGRDIEGILGVPFFQTNIVQLDFDHREFRILDGNTKSLNSWGTPITVTETDSGLPTVALTIGDQFNEECVIDTGYLSSLSLHHSSFEKLLQSHIVKLNRGTRLVTMNGAQHVRAGMISTVKLDGFKSKKLRVSEIGGKSRLGLDYLRRFRVTFDLPHSRMYLAKSATFVRADAAPFVGMNVLRKNGRTVITYVYSKSPAEKAGVIANDELRFVENTPITDQPLAEIRWLIDEKARHDKIVSLGIRRGDKERRISLQLKD